MQCLPHIFSLLLSRFGPWVGCMCIEKTGEYCKSRSVGPNVYKGYRNRKFMSLWNSTYRINILKKYFIKIAVGLSVKSAIFGWLVGWFPNNNCLHQTVADVIFILQKYKCQPIECCRYKYGQCHLQPQIACDIYKWAILRQSMCINDEL